MPTSLDTFLSLSKKGSKWFRIALQSSAGFRNRILYKAKLQEEIGDNLFSFWFRDQERKKETESNFRLG